MDHEPEPEVIRKQMEVRRAALTEKLETLESRIVATVDDAREAVAETVESVRAGVKESVETVKDTVHVSALAVKDTFDLQRQVERHPWPMFGGAIAVGFAAGWALNEATASAPSPRTPALAGVPHLPPAHRPEQPPPRAFPAAAPGGSWTEQCFQLFQPEIAKMKSLVIGAVMGVVREIVTEPLPGEMRSKIGDIMDNITTKLGGETVASATVAPLVTRLHADHHNGHHREEVHGGSFGNDWRTNEPGSM